MSEVTITAGIYSIARIEKAAQQCAAKGLLLDTANPFPQHTTARALFDKAYNEACAASTTANQTEHAPA